MNRLKKDSLYGMYPEWDDWDWTQDAVKDAIKHLLAQWGLNNDSYYILYGCESALNGGTNAYEIQPGAVVLDGEILPVDAHTVANETPASGMGFQFKLVTSYDPAGQEPTQSGPNIDAYEVRKAEVQWAATEDPGGPIPHLPMTGPRLQEIITEQTLQQVDSNNGDWIVATFQNGWSGGIVPLSYRLDAFGYLELRGTADGTAATADVVCRLPLVPVNHRPNVIIYGQVFDTAGVLHPVWIDTAGYVHIGAYGSATDVHNCNSIRLRKDY